MLSVSLTPKASPFQGVVGPANSSYGQVCWHHQSLIDFLIDQTKSVLTAQPWSTFISVTVRASPRQFRSHLTSVFRSRLTWSVLPLQQNDNIRFCDDPEELAIVAENGGAQISPMLAAVRPKLFLQKIN